MVKTNLETNIRPSKKHFVKLKKCGHISEVVWVERRNKKCNIIRLDKEHYMKLNDDISGLVYEFQHKATSRIDNLKYVSKSLENLRDLINCNIDDVRKCRWITLTYAENMTDTVRLYKDFEKFIKRLRYRYGKFEYIVAMEPQGRGAWHAHVALIFDDIAPFIPNAELSEIWGFGFVVIRRIDDVDNVGAYLTAYLGDMELSEAIENGSIVLPSGVTADMLPNDLNGLKTVDYVDENGEKKTKKFIKGARLHMYPNGFNLYRSSRGVKRPIISEITAEQAEKKVSADTLTFEKTVMIEDTKNNFKTIINHRYYNSKRPKSQDVVKAAEKNSSKILDILNENRLM